MEIVSGGGRAFHAFRDGLGGESLLEGHKSIDHFLADFEAEEAEGVDDYRPGHHDTEAPEEDVHAFLALFLGAVPGPLVVWFL